MKEISVKRNYIFKRILSQKYLYILVVPSIIWFLIFNYIPMFGVVIAFKKYTFAKGILGSDWAGFEYFRQFLTGYNFKVILKNTLGISFLKILFCFPAPIILALMLNEVKNAAFKRTVQTVSYLPHFISWVIVIGIWDRLLSIDGGAINKLLVSLNFINEPINFILTSKYMWPMAVITEIWKTIGFSSIIYLAALSSINPELYEASRIDGAGRFNQLIHITIPGIKPTVAILFIFAIGGIFTSNFDQLYIMGLKPVLNVTEVIDTYIYRYGLQNLQYSIGAAAGLMRSVIALLLVLITNKVIKLLGEEGLW